MVWYEELGFDENPLDVRPNTELVGLDKQEQQLKNHIEKGEICFLHGLTGSGKTSLLKKLQKDMNDYKFIYLDAQDLPADFNLEQELKKKRSFFDKIRLKDFPSKEPVLIIDEFQETDENVIMEARAKWEDPDDRKIKSIIIAQIDNHLENVTDSFKERIGKRTIEMPTLTDSEMKEILKKRLDNGDKNYYNKLHSEAVNLLVACADGNPRRLLEYTDLIFDFHHQKFGDKNPLTESDTYLVTYYGAKEILEKEGVNVESYTYLEPEERLRQSEVFEDKFNEEERELIIYMMTTPRTADNVADKLDVSKSTAYKKLRNLREKDAIEEAGTKDRKKLWTTTEHVKRLTVKV